MFLLLSSPLIVTLFTTFSLPIYLFNSPLFSTLISLFLHPFIFLYFDYSHSHPITMILLFSLSHSIHSFPTHKKWILSFSSQPFFFPFIFGGFIFIYFSWISILDWWIFMFYTLGWCNLILDFELVFFFFFSFDG